MATKKSLLPLKVSQDHPLKYFEKDKPGWRFSALIVVTMGKVVISLGGVAVVVFFLMR